MENTTQKENELIGNTDNLKPEQMESGKWYVIETSFNYLIKFKETLDSIVKAFSCYNNYLETHEKDNAIICSYSDIKSIRPATNEEVLKYFPNEVFEPIELKPEETDWKAKFKELQKINNEIVEANRNYERQYRELRHANDELNKKIIDIEFEQNNQEKVYFYLTVDKVVYSTIHIQTAIDKSKNESEIYEAICIGVKKSVLVNENS